MKHLHIQFYFPTKSSSRLYHMMTRSKRTIIFKRCGLDPEEPYPSHTTTSGRDAQQ